MMPDEWSVPGVIPPLPLEPELGATSPDAAPEYEEADPFFNVYKDASMTECTGLMPAMVQDPAQGETLSDIESIHTIKGPHEEN